MDGVEPWPDGSAIHKRRGGEGGRGARVGWSGVKGGAPWVEGVMQVLVPLAPGRMKQGSKGRRPVKRLGEEAHQAHGGKSEGT